MTDYQKELIPYTSVDYYDGDLRTNDLRISLKKVLKNQPRQLKDNVTVIYIVEGGAELRINGEKTLVEAGQLMMLMSYHVYAFEKIPDQDCSYYDCQFSIGLLLLAKTSKSAYLNSLKELDKGLPIVSLTVTEQQECLSLLEKLRQELVSAETWGQDILVLHSTTGLIYLFLKGIKRREELIKKRPVNQNWQLLQYIHFHHQKDLRLRELESEFQLSQTEIRDKLLALTGLTFAQNLNRVRIINASALLAFDGLSINQIGRIVGYKNDAHFYKEFKQAKNCSPKSYQQGQGLTEDEGYCDETTAIFIYLYENYRKDLSLLKVSQALNIATKKIRSLLADDFQMSLGELVKRLRMLNGKGLLDYQDLGIAQISEFLGYQDVKVFRKEFKETYGCPPMTYRRNRQKS